MWARAVSGGPNWGSGSTGAAAAGLQCVGGGGREEAGGLWGWRLGAGVGPLASSASRATIGRLGRVAEWTNATDCKSVCRKALVGSNPTATFADCSKIWRFPTWEAANVRFGVERAESPPGSRRVHQSPPQNAKRNAKRDAKVMLGRGGVVERRWVRRPSAGAVLTLGRRGRGAEVGKGGEGRGLGAAEGVGVAVHRQRDGGVPGEGLHGLGVDAAVDQVGDEAVPKAVEVGHAAGGVSAGEEG